MNNVPGHEKCNALREIRKQIAEENGLVYEPIECNHTGPCAGTCPVCDSEMADLMRQLEEKQARGEEVNVSGIAACFVPDRLFGDADSFRRAWDDDMPLAGVPVPPEPGFESAGDEYKPRWERWWERIDEEPMMGSLAFDPNSILDEKLPEPEDPDEDVDTVINFYGSKNRGK